LLQPDQAVVLDEAIQGMMKLQDLDVRLFIVSNQSCVNRGLISEDRAWELHGIIIKKLADAGIRIHDSRLCTHVDQDVCACRKPKPGMILDLCNQYGIAPEESIMIGDSETDMAAGKSAGCLACVMIGTGSEAGDAACGDLSAAADLIQKSYYAS